MTATLTARRRPSSAPPDAACAAAVELARAAAAEAGGTDVGDHLGVEAEADRVATHLFATLDRAYPGWRWAVTVARASRAKGVTVDGVVLLPGPQSLLAPAWVPWSERVRPGDLGAGDLLPTEENDDRLVPAYAAGDDPAADEVAWELGLGRVRVLSPVGRLEAAERWYDGDGGPESPLAKAAPARCVSCGFLTQLAGSLRQLFGVCANEFAPDDGRVVSLDHGCGAHSEAVVASSTPPVAARHVDDYSYEFGPAAAPPVAPPVERPLGSVTDSEPAEPFGHS